jgi:hypothetical protein
VSTIVLAQAQPNEPVASQAEQIEFLITLGTLKYGNVDASGTRQLLALTRDNTGTAIYQYLTTEDSKNIEEVMVQRGLIKPLVNRKTNKVERHVLVFNPKDKHTYEWIPLSNARAIAQQIKTTGKTVLEEQAPRRLNEGDLSGMSFKLSF